MGDEIPRVVLPEGDVFFGCFTQFYVGGEPYLRCSSNGENSEDLLKNLAAEFGPQLTEHTGYSIASKKGQFVKEGCTVVLMSDSDEKQASRTHFERLVINGYIPLGIDIRVQ